MDAAGAARLYWMISGSIGYICLEQRNSLSCGIPELALLPYRRSERNAKWTDGRKALRA